MLLGLTFSNGNTNNNENHNDLITIQNAEGSDPGTGIDPGDTGGDTGPILPPKK